MNRRPTDEQSRAIECARGGRDLAIEALAGTGKTTTLAMIAESVLRSGVYVTFSKAMADEAKRSFPAHVDCRTAHSLAFASVGHRYRDRLNGVRVPYAAIVDTLRCKAIELKTPEGRRVVGPVVVATQVMEALRNFVKSTAAEPGRDHVSRWPGLDPAAEVVLIDRVFEHLAAAWDDLRRPVGMLPFSHDVYLKLWQLSKPQLRTDCVLFDEAQDADPVMLDIVLSQPGQKILVGDRNQQIYAWRGAVNAIENLPMKERTWLTQSFRFGQAIADEANVHLRALSSPQLLRGNPEIRSAVGAVERPTAILCRSNSKVLRQVIECRAAGVAVAVADALQRALLSFAQAAQRLQDGKPVDHPGLAGFETWDDVVEHVHESETDGELAQMVRLIEDNGCAVVVATIGRCVAESKAEVLVTTAHRAKGRQWQTVGLADDFPDVEEMEVEERRLAYVGATRAVTTLDTSHWYSKNPTDWFSAQRRSRL